MIRGVYAALLVPRDGDGRPDLIAFGDLVEFLVGKGVAGVVLNGATGEYCLTSADELKALLETCRAAARGKAAVLCGVGAAGLDGVLERGRAAITGGADGLLLPMPHFFPYEQDDLRAFCIAAALRLQAPTLLYNLPKFTTPIEFETVEAIMAEAPNVLGIKDSSGSIELLRRLRGCRVVGNDSALAPALEAGVCDAVISGVACVLPELVQSVWAGEGAALLDEFIEQLAPFPTPWGLKAAAEARGLARAAYAQPLSERRKRQAAELASWFAAWWPKAEAALAPAARA